MSRPPERSPWSVLVSTGLAMFAVFLDTTILFVAFPAIRADFETVSASSLSWVLNAYTIVFAALLIPAGRFADRIGRRRMFLAAAVAFTVASMLCGLAPTPALLVVARILQASAAAALVPSSLALVLQTFPRHKLPVAVAIWGAIGAVAGAAGPTLGALVVENIGWRWAFYVNLPVGIVSLLLGRRVLPEGRESSPGRLPDPVGVVLLAAGMALVAFALVRTDEWGWASGRFAGCLLVGLVLVAAFVARCATVPNPVLDLTLFRSPGFRWANLAMLGFAIGFNAMFLGNVLFLTQVWGYTVLRAGLAISIGPAIVAATAPWFGRLAGRIGQRPLLYPVPDPRFPFLGVHLSRTIRGDVIAGPNAVLAFAREGYGRLSFNGRDLAEVLRDRRFHRLARKFWRTGMAEMWRDWSKRAYLRELQRYVPELRAEHLVFGPSGVRAQAVDPDGSMVDDFRLGGDDRILHVRNAPSPAATASLAIAAMLADTAEERFGL